MTTTTRVHLLRHGEVHNPDGVLYGRLPGYHLSERGVAMANRIAETVADRDIAAVVSSPLERAQETAAPVAAKLGLEVMTDDRLTEATNVFQGLTLSFGGRSLLRVKNLKYLLNPFRPSWGEPYVELVARMRDVTADARAATDGREALLVSHQLPIWILRRAVEGQRLWHDPRKRVCSLASLTTFTFEADEIVSVAYSEPAADLMPPSRRHPVAGA
ncbi:MAG TPA: histidine phosphatase family protein [Jiangellaceae bacterium]|nr:histidine phosphatase family protein [Jiangellaceae bacterium]